MSDDPASKHAFRWELRQRLVERLRIPWDGMGDMGNQQRAEAAIAISTMMDEIEEWRRCSQKAERDIAELIRERDTIRRTFCFMIASSNLNARDGNTAFRIGAEWVAELNHWKCFEENN